MMLPLYRLATHAGGPLIAHYLRRRRACGREDAARFRERQGVASLTRPPGFLVWFHAASLGEALSVLPLVEQMIAEWPSLEVLLTTGTRSSAEVLAQRLPERTRHHYVPADRPCWVRNFLSHWRPDLALWVESELWPNLLLETARRHVPMVLLNARLSERSFHRWHLFRSDAGLLLRHFSLCLAQSEETAERLRRLGAPMVRHLGNLKAAAPPLPADAGELASLRALCGTRPRWLAASTHPGEEEIAAAVHRRVASRLPALLTLIVPRHPKRGEAIATLLARQGLRVARRSQGAPLAPETEIYLADTIGELGLFYRLVDLTFLGGSLMPRGGHNPLEPARLDCAILHGPSTENFRHVYADLGAAGAARPVQDRAGLADQVAHLLTDPAAGAAMATAALRHAAAGTAVLDRVLDALRPHLPPLAPATDLLHARA